MKQRSAAFAIVGALALAPPSFAADMPVKAPPVAPAAFTWTGLYLGGHAGFGQAGVDITFPAPNDFTNAPLTEFPLTRGNTLSGFLAGAHLGFNYQVGKLVFGIEGAWTWTDWGSRFASPEAPAAHIWTTDLDWLASVTGRIGVADARRFHGYVKGGWAATRIHTRLDCIAIDCRFGAFDDATTTHHGWTAGVGIEWAFWDNWIFGIEYNHYDFGDRRHSGPGPAFTSALPCTTGGAIGCLRDVDATVDTVTARLSYKFGGFLLP
jgi:outer membrane immunogenic protein